MQSLGRQSARNLVINVVVACYLLFARPAVTFTDGEHHRPLTSTTMRETCVCEQLAHEVKQPEVKPVTY